MKHFYLLGTPSRAVSSSWTVEAVLSKFIPQVSHVCTSECDLTFTGKKR